jgi:guanosine-3',5'-bis(diphosphate) 3'-pyrophosphohydrolase
MSINKQIVELHSKLHRLVDREELYFSESHRKFIVAKKKGKASYYNELPSKLSGLIYETCWGTETTKVDICNERSPDKETHPHRVLYSTEVLQIEKLYLYGEYHTQTIEAAVYFAARHHGEQVRKSNYEPYTLHLFEVLNLIKSIEIGVNEATLIASLLHDVVEDTHVTIESIELLFGNDIANIVAELTCEKAATSDEKKQILLEQIKTASVPAKIIKLADVISNSNSIPSSWTDEKKQSYLNWCDEVAAVCKGTSENLYHVYIQKRAVSAPE